jgi:endoglucanase
LAPSLPDGKGKYGEVLGLAWKFFEAQRSGPTPGWNRIKWRSDSHLNDATPGGWYDAGDYLKLNFPMAPSVGLNAWGILEFKAGYTSNGELNNALNNLKVAADYLAKCLNWNTGQYIGQIGDPTIDHSYWGRPEQQTGARPAYYYNRTMGAADLYGGVAGALASSAMVFQDNGDSAFADELLRVAKELYSWGLEKDGKYSDFYKKQTASIYKSYDSQDNMAWAGGWLYRATNDVTYLNQALSYYTKGTPDYYPGWDSLWAQHSAHMVSLSNMGHVIPGIELYTAYMDKFLRAWLVADGFEDVISTPLGLHYPKWNEWANLAFSSSAAAVVSISAKYNNDPVQRAAQVEFVQKQVDYILGSGYRSYVVGYGHNPPQFPHHASSSCPDMPAPCGEKQFTSKDPNPQILYGALVAGPAGVRKSVTDPDATYNDKRSDYVTNEVANDYNAGFTMALAGIYCLL